MTLEELLAPVEDEKKAGPEARFRSSERPS
jgi:hypothetical protein